MILSVVDIWGGVIVEGLLLIFLWKIRSFSWKEEDEDEEVRNCYYKEVLS